MPAPVLCTQPYSGAKGGRTRQQGLGAACSLHRNSARRAVQVPQAARVTLGKLLLAPLRTAVSALVPMLRRRQTGVTQRDIFHLWCLRRCRNTRHRQSRAPSHHLYEGTAVQIGHVDDDRKYMGSRSMSNVDAIQLRWDRTDVPT